MKNLLTILLASGALFSFNQDSFESDYSKTISRVNNYASATKKVQNLNEEDKKALIRCFREYNQYLPSERILIRPCYSDTTDFNVKGKKVRNGNHYLDYMLMVDPKSEKIRELFSDINSQGTNYDRAKEIYNKMETLGIRKGFDPGQSLDELEELKEKDSFAFETIKDYIRHPDQSVKDSIIDCEDFSIIFVSAALFHNVPAAMATAPGHAFVLIKLNNLNNLELSQIDPANLVIDCDGNSWFPLDVASIRERSFEKAIEEGIPYFRELSFVLIPEQYKDRYSY